jgi:pseudaminic acid synthase
MDEQAFTQMVKDVRMAEAAMGEVTYQLTEKQRAGRCFARSLYVAEDMKAGDVITEKNVRSVRPGYGAAPKHLPEVIGKRVKVDLEKGSRFLVEYAE